MKSEVRIFIAIIFIGNFVAQFSSCSSCNNPKPVTVDTTKPKPVVTVHVPEFDADSSYRYCDVQVKFGPRIPGTKSQQQCAAYLEKMLKRYCDTVYVQKANVKVYDGTEKPMINLIGSFNPKAKKRILLLAHWDTRPWSDRDANEPKKQFDGADDGGSGVGILIECAEQFQKQKPNVGVDILLCDVEDYGPPEFESKWDETDQYALGTQYWANHPHAKNYRSFYGILLDMAAAKGAVFSREGISSFNAGWVQDKVWANASTLGFGSFFVNQAVGSITDDHVYINQIAKIPTVDIIHIDLASPSGTFGSYWHTHADDMSVIDKTTLNAVGKTLLYTIYQYDAERGAQ